MSIATSNPRQGATFGWIAASALSLFLLACSKAPEPAAVHLAPTSIAWVKPVGADIEPIWAQAKTSNKPVFLYWGAVWCPPCNQIKATVFNRLDFIERSQFFVPVYLDGDTPGAQKLAARFKVRGYPTMILFRPDGTEVTRLPGEVDAPKYMELLNIGLAASSSVKESLALALGSTSASVAPDAWRQLAYYAWEYDEAALLAQPQRAAAVHKLALACPATQQEAANRLALKAVLLAALDKKALLDAAAAQQRTGQILADPALARANFDVLVNYSVEMLGVLSAPGSAARATLASAWTGALERFALDASLSRLDRLSVVSASIALAKLDLPKGQSFAPDAALLGRVRAAALSAEQTTRDAYEREAVIPGAASLLSEAGLLDESDQLLKAELPKSMSPYYPMLVLAANARQRGDKVAALDWAEQAWKASVGSATRLQWGSGYVNRLIELAPHDSARIHKAAAAVLAELEVVPETFYERNRRGLEKMGQRLLAWSKTREQAAVIGKLSAQLKELCARLPAQDETQAICTGVLKPGAKQAT